MRVCSHFDVTLAERHALSPSYAALACKSVGVEFPDSHEPNFGLFAPPFLVGPKIKLQIWSNNPFFFKYDEFLKQICIFLNC